MMAKTKVPRQTGDIVKIDLGDGSFCFARVLEEPLMAFYDMKVTTVPEVEAIVVSPILFRVWVMTDAVTSGRWPIIGNISLDDDLKIAPKFFKQDPITKSLSVYYRGHEIPATRAECEQLERAAVWEPEHIEERLRDYYSGVPNRWVDSLRPQ